MSNYQDTVIFLISFVSKNPDEKGRTTLTYAEAMDINAKSMEALDFNFSRLSKAGKSVTVGNVINHFSEVEKANGSDSDTSKLKKRYKGFTIRQVARDAYGWKLEIVKKCAKLPDMARVKKGEF